VNEYVAHRHLAIAERCFEAIRGINDNYTALVHDGHATAQAIGLFHVMSRQEYRSAVFGAQPLDVLPNRFASQWVKPDRRLIEQ